MRLGRRVADGRGEERQAERRERDADPFAAGHLVREEAIGGDGEEDEPARDRCLDEGDGRKREGAHVEAPAHRRREDPERVPGVTEECERGPERLSHVDLGHRDRAAVLVEKPEHGGERRREREQEADLDRDGHAPRRLRIRQLVDVMRP